MRIYTQRFSEPDRKISEEERKEIDKSVGVSIIASPIVELSGTLIAEKALGYPVDDKTEATIVHEEQHAIKKLFLETGLDVTAMGEIEDAKDYDQFKVLLRRYMRGYMLDKVRVAKDEALAYYKEGQKDANDIYNVLTTPKDLGGVYDYFADSKLDIQKRLIEFLGDSHEGVIKDISDEVFEDEYKDILRDGLIAVNKLNEKGYMREEIVNILINEPMEKWPRVAGLLKKNKV